tara:strand:- start:2652 stop:2903 length:252 start_codon:yes stop_codon:yes gene_type:complete
MQDKNIINKIIKKIKVNNIYILAQSNIIDSFLENFCSELDLNHINYRVGSLWIEKELLQTGIEINPIIRQYLETAIDNSIQKS